MNFREELAKIRRGPIPYHPDEETQNKEYAERILKDILKYYEENLKGRLLCEAKEINFLIGKFNEIEVRIFDLDEEDGKYPMSFRKYSSNSKKEAKNVLLLLHNKFKSESYRIMYGKTVEEDEEFAVLID